MIKRAGLRLALVMLFPAGLWGAATLQEISLDSLVPYRQVHLLAKSDTLTNCDSASGAKILLQEKTPAGPGLFRAGGRVVSQFTFQKYAGDTLYFLVTVPQSEEEDIYVGVCLEKSRLAKAYVDDANRRAGGKAGKGKSEGGGGFPTRLLILAGVLVLIFLLST